MLALIGIRATTALAQDDDRGVVAVRDPAGNEVLSFGESHALLIGASAYNEGWRPLPGVKRDLVELERVFVEHGFDVQLVEDPDADELLEAFETFIREHGREETNRLLFYYAGHGHTITLHERPRGFLVPTDAPLPDEDLDTFLDKALPLHRMGSLALDIQARHAIFFFDSCFSGSVFGDLQRSPPPPPASITYLTGKPVRQFISSGSEGQTVPDRSEFRVQLVDALDGKTDLSMNDEYVTGTELGNFLFRAVMDSSGEQTPQYGALEDGVYDKGDFVFVIPPEDETAEAGGGSPAAPLGGSGASSRGAISTVAVLPPTLIDLGDELREGFGEAIVNAVNDSGAEALDPDTVSGTLTPVALGSLAACEADDLCLLQVCDLLDVGLAVATVFEEFPGPSYAAEVIVIDDAQCNLVGRETKLANQLALLRSRAEKAAKTLISGWLQ